MSARFWLTAALATTLSSTVVAQPKTPPAPPTVSCEFLEILSLIHI